MIGNCCYALFELEGASSIDPRPAAGVLAPSRATRKRKAPALDGDGGGGGEGQQPRLVNDEDGNLAFQQPVSAIPSSSSDAKAPSEDAELPGSTNCGQPATGQPVRSMRFCVAG